MNTIKKRRRAARNARLKRRIRIPHMRLYVPPEPTPRAQFYMKSPVGLNRPHESTTGSVPQGKTMRNSPRTPRTQRTAPAPAPPPAPRRRNSPRPPPIIRSSFRNATPKPPKRITFMSPILEENESPRMSPEYVRSPQIRRSMRHGPSPKAKRSLFSDDLFASTRLPAPTPIKK